MSDAYKIAAILHDQWGDEADIVGNSTVLDVARSVVSGGTFESARGGADMDVKDVLDILVSAATLIKVTIEIWKAVRESKKTTPDPSEVGSQVVKDPRVTPLNQGIRERLSDIIEIISSEY